MTTLLMHRNCSSPTSFQAHISFGMKKLAFRHFRTSWTKSAAVMHYSPTKNFSNGITNTVYFPKPGGTYMYVFNIYGEILFHGIFLCCGGWGTWLVFCSAKCLGYNIMVIYIPDRLLPIYTYGTTALCSHWSGTCGWEWGVALGEAPLECRS